MHILVHLELDNNPQTAIDAAVRLVKTSGGHLHFFTCTYATDFDAYSSRQAARQKLCDDTREKINQLTADLPLASDRVSLEREVVWNQYPAEMLVQSSARHGADLIITLPFKTGPAFKESEQGARQRLLRSSVCPILWLRHGSEHYHRSLLAAVAIEADNDEHDLLNNRIVATAKKMCRATAAELGVVAALDKTVNVVQMLKIVEDRDEAKLSNEVLLSQRYGIDPDKVHVDYGSPSQVIGEVTASTGADLLVIGTIARKGLSGAVVGNTCETVLDQVATDLLIVN